MKKIQKSKKGFTLVEMVLVIAIIVILGNRQRSLIFRRANC